MARKPLSPYPRAGDLQRTFETRAKLAGARRFLAGEGLVVFAYEKEGVAQAVADTWLPPSAYRRMAQHLDLAGGPSVAGFRLARVARRGETLDIGPATAFDDFRQQAGRLSGQETDPARRTMLRASQQVDGAFAWRGDLVHDGFYDLVGGERISAELTVPMSARAAPDAGVDVAVVLSGPDDLTAAQRWLAHACPSSAGWVMEPVGLTDAGNVQETGRIIAALVQAGWNVLGISFLDAFRAGAVVIDGDRFAHATRRARYDTELVGIDVVREKLDRDDAKVAGLTLFLQRPSRRRSAAPEPIVSLRLQQALSRPALQVIWAGGRQPPKEGLQGTLTRELWDELAHVNWDREQKQRYVASAWLRVGDALLDEDSGAGAERVPG